jgi:epoxyqueuosine reductase
MSCAELTRRVKEEAGAIGFARVGVAATERLELEGGQLDAWLEAGRHGQMEWMAQTAQVRKDPGHPDMLSGAKSVVVLAAPYLRSTNYDGPWPGRVAKYALGRDYHGVLTKKARRLQSLLQDSGYQARVAVDSKPVFERAWAERAGLGFVGKNCCLIVPGIGSHVFLACIVTTAPLVADEAMVRKCGTCTLCLEACPSQAFEGPHTLDARKCISYLTIEHRGPIPEEQRAALGPWIFGCDVCQDVCPYNQTSATTEAPLEAFAPGDRWQGIDAVSLLEMDEEYFRAWGRGSAVKRAGHEGLARNAALVLGNRGKEIHLRVLEDTKQTHASAVVRDAAAWASTRLKRRLAASE